MPIGLKPLLLNDCLQIGAMGVGDRTKTDESAVAMVSAKMAKAMSNRWRAQIMAEIRARPLSPSQFVDEVGGEITNISRCFRQLEKWGFLELVETRRGGRRRGGIEHVYRPVKRAYLDTDSWERLPLHLKDDFSGAIINTFIERVVEAIDVETLNKEPAQHLSWDSPMLDRQAWIELTDRLDEVLDWVPELAAESADRMAKSGEEPIPTTVGLFAFRSPKPSERTAKADTKAR